MPKKNLAAAPVKSRTNQQDFFVCVHAGGDVSFAKLDLDAGKAHITLFIPNRKPVSFKVPLEMWRESRRVGQFRTLSTMEVEGFVQAFKDVWYGATEQLHGTAPVYTRKPAAASL